MLRLTAYAYHGNFDRVVHFSAGCIYSFVLNNFLTCGLVVGYNEEYARIRQSPFPIEALLVILGGLNVLALVIFAIRARWVALGLVGAVLLNELLWLLAGARDPITIVMPIWMAVGYLD